MHYLTLASLAVPVVGALLAMRAATIKVRDNVDEFIKDLVRQGFWNSIAVLVTALGTILTAIAVMHQG